MNSMTPVLVILTLALLSTASPVDKFAKELNQVESRSEEKTQNRSETVVIEEAILVKNWPSIDVTDFIGPVSGLSFCPKGFLFIFHRADREMNERSFDGNNRYIQEEEGPISESTILKMSNKINEPQIVAEMGDNIFYLPHGIFADKKYVWTTDLALHQVLRFPHGSKVPDLILGEKFIPGSDRNHFCKPTHAITASDGSLFVADGYCNSRVMKFDRSGIYVTQFGDKKGAGQLNLPHHLVIIESKDLICVADRENYRIQCFSAGISDSKATGTVKKVIHDVRFGPIYAIGYNSLNGIMYIVSGSIGESDKSRVFLYNWDNDIITGVINYEGSNGFGMAHTISVCPKQRCLAIGSLTKECPAEIETCMERSEEDPRYLPRNVWLYGLVDEKIELE